jgi:hypothetical protein
MSGIAEVLHTLGYSVQGSDIADSANVRRLRDAGIPVAVGHVAPGDVAAARVFQLDDLGAEEGKDLGAGGSGLVVRHVDHAQPGEGLANGSLVFAHAFLRFLPRLRAAVWLAGRYRCERCFAMARPAASRQRSGNPRFASASRMRSRPRSAAVSFIRARHWRVQSISPIFCSRWKPRSVAS